MNQGDRSSADSSRINILSWGDDHIRNALLLGGLSCARGFDGTFTALFSGLKVQPHFVSS